MIITNSRLPDWVLNRRLSLTWLMILVVAVMPIKTPFSSKLKMCSSLILYSLIVLVKRSNHRRMVSGCVTLTRLLSNVRLYVISSCWCRLIKRFVQCFSTCLVEFSILNWSSSEVKVLRVSTLDEYSQLINLMHYSTRAFSSSLLKILRLSTASLCVLRSRVRA